MQVSRNSAVGTCVVNTYRCQLISHSCLEARPMRPSSRQLIVALAPTVLFLSVAVAIAQTRGPIARDVARATTAPAPKAPSPATSDRVGLSPWGPNDEIGTLNMMN